MAEGAGFFGKIVQQQTTPAGALTLLHHFEGRRLPRHVHDRPYLLLLLRGGYREHVASREINYDRSSLVYHPAHFDHHDEVAPEGATFFVVGLASSVTTDRSFGEVPEHCAEALALFVKFRAGIATALDVEESLVQLHRASAIRLKNERIVVPWLRRVIDRLHVETGTEWSLSDLAEEAGVHPGHLSRAFRQRLGMRMGDYVSRIRLDRALSLLAGGERLSDIAQACGFSDHAHFARVCRAMTGSAPSELRTMIAEVNRPSDGAS
jgi:AraC family transcriptional regulator